MRPPDGKPTRRGMRRARRGIPTGRRATHTVVTSYGRHQKQRAWDALIAVVFADRQQQAAPED